MTLVPIEPSCRTSPGSRARRCELLSPRFPAVFSLFCRPARQRVWFKAVEYGSGCDVWVDSSTAQSDAVLPSARGNVVACSWTTIFGGHNDGILWVCFTTTHLRCLWRNYFTCCSRLFTGARSSRETLHFLPQRRAEVAATIAEDWIEPQGAEVNVILENGVVCSDTL